jgi:hypothetical protein
MENRWKADCGCVYSKDPAIREAWVKCKEHSVVPQNQKDTKENYIETKKMVNKAEKEAEKYLNQTRGESNSLEIEEIKTPSKPVEEEELIGSKQYVWHCKTCRCI